jgi:hypothetical protein
LFFGLIVLLNKPTNDYRKKFKINEKVAQYNKKSINHTPGSSQLLIRIQLFMMINRKKGKILHSYKKEENCPLLNDKFLV